MNLEVSCKFEDTFRKALEDIKKPFVFHDPIYIAPKGFKFLPVPHLCMPLEFAKELSKSEEAMVTMEVYKGSSCGKSESLMDIPSFYMPLELNKYMEDLKSKYPDWRAL